MKTLRDHRMEAGMTQEDLSQRAGIRVATISALENGRSQPRKGTLNKLASALNMEIDDLRLSIQGTVESHQTMIDSIQSDWSFLNGLDRDLRKGLAQSLVASDIGSLRRIPKYPTNAS